MITAGHVVLRVRTADGDFAVRLSLTDPEREVDVAARVLRDVPEARAASCPVVVAEGRTAGRPWVATEWTPRRRRPLTWPWPRATRQWAVADELAEVLAGRGDRARPTPAGPTRWCARAHVVPAEVRERWAADAGRPRRRPAHRVVPRRPLARQRAPRRRRQRRSSTGTTPATTRRSALDALLVHALRETAGTDDLVSESLLRLVDDPLPLADAAVGGRPWARLGPPERRALALAAVVLYLRNRSLHDLGQERLDRHLAAVDRSLDDRPRRRPRRPAPAPPSVEAARTARGALWLATNGIVVKTSQTVVLLTLAAMLAPSALGVVALGTLVANVSAVVTSLGTASALVYWRGDVLRAARTAVTVGVAMGAGIAGAALDRRALAGLGVPRRGRRRGRHPRPHRDPAVPGRRRRDQRAAAPPAGVRAADHPRHRLLRRRGGRGDRAGDAGPRRDGARRRPDRPGQPDHAARLGGAPAGAPGLEPRGRPRPAVVRRAVRRRRTCSSWSSSTSTT